MAKKRSNQIKKYSRNLLLGNATFACFLAVLGLVYIFNAHHSEKKIRSINTLKTEVRDAHDKYMKVKKEVMIESTATQLEEALKEKGLKNQKKIPVLISQS